ncbi:MAG: RNA polymerase sigma factor [Chloroflexota bacterium]
MTASGSDQGGESSGPTDEVLIARLASHDSSALGELYDRYGRLAYGLAYRMLGDAGAAEDAVQEAFLGVWRNAPRFDPKRGVVRSWLLTAVRNRCIDVLRGTRRWIEVDDSGDVALQVAAPDDVWESVLRDLQARDVQRALADLPEEQRATILLAYFKGLTHAQIADQMHVPLGTVKGRMRLAMEKLRDLLVGASGVEPAAEV